MTWLPPAVEGAVRPVVLAALRAPVGPQTPGLRPDVGDPQGAYRQLVLA